MLDVDVDDGVLYSIHKKSKRGKSFFQYRGQLTLQMCRDLFHNCKTDMEKKGKRLVKHFSIYTLHVKNVKSFILRVFFYFQVLFNFLFFFTNRNRIFVSLFFYFFYFIFILSKSIDISVCLRLLVETSIF